MSGWEIKKETLNQRCEICHQQDCFDATTNICSRCYPVLIERKAIAQQPVFAPARLTTLLDQRRETPGLLHRLTNSILDMPGEIANRINSLRAQGWDAVFDERITSLTNYNAKTGFYRYSYMLAALVKYLFIIFSVVWALLVLGIIIQPSNALINFVLFLAIAIQLWLLSIVCLAHVISHQCKLTILGHE